MNSLNSIISNCILTVPVVSLNSTGIGTVTINVNVPFTDINQNKIHRFIFNTTNNFSDSSLQYYVDFSYNQNIYTITTSTGGMNGGYSGYNLLSNGTTYYFVFTYTNDNIIYSNYSSTVIATPTLLAPTSLSARPGNQSVIINFTQTTFVGSSIITSYYYSLNGGAYKNSNLTFTSSSCIITGLTNGTNYTVTLKAYNRSYSEASSSITFTPVLSAPTNLSTTPGNESVKINFTQVTDSSPITSYYYSLNRGAYTNVNLTFTSSSCIITGLTNGTNYTITLKAYNGFYSLESSSITFTPILPAPTNLSATPGHESVRINFTQVTDSSPITSYYYSLNGDVYTNVNLTFNSSSCIITGLTNGTNYTITLKAYNGFYSLESSSITFTPVLPAPLPAPTNLSATPDNGSVKINFTQVTDSYPIISYYYSLNGAAYTNVNLTFTSSYCIITGLTNGTNYTMTLKVYNGSYSVASSSINFTPFLLINASITTDVSYNTYLFNNITYYYFQFTNTNKTNVINFLNITGDNDISLNILSVGGGGAGGIGVYSGAGSGAGGGGAGAVGIGSYTLRSTMQNIYFSINIGIGGVNAIDGSNTIININNNGNITTEIAYGGGVGGNQAGSLGGKNGYNGSSGGGSANLRAAGTGNTYKTSLFTYYGNSGGYGYGGNGTIGGGGGGAGGVGTIGMYYGAGGSGLLVNIKGIPTGTYGQGGGGGAGGPAAGPSGTGYGGGGGGGCRDGGVYGSGGNPGNQGIVIISINAAYVRSILYI